MICEVISIGDELTSGQRLDTNSQWISERLGELGLRALYHTTVADDLAANVRVFRAAMDRADLVIATGGLGPTADDLTRQALAEAAARPLILDPAALTQIEQLFARRGRAMPERNKTQAYFPAGANVIPNPQGTAPGIDLSLPRGDRPAARIIALPGVPAELKEMWRATVGPSLASLSGGRLIRHYRVKCFGVGESDLEAMLPDLIRRGRDPQVGITVHQATITLRVTAHGQTPDQCAAHARATLDEIHRCLGDLVYGEEDDELHEVVVRLLAARAQTLSVVECGTGGLLADWLSLADPRGDVFLGGLVLRGAALHSLGQLAAEAQAELATDFVLVCGPFPVTEANPPQPSLPLAVGEPSNPGPGEFRYGVLAPTGWREKTARYAGHSDILRDRSGKTALNFLRLQLLGRD